MIRARRLPDGKEPLGETVSHDLANIFPGPDVEGVFAWLGGEDGECAGRLRWEGRWGGGWVGVCGAGRIRGRGISAMTLLATCLVNEELLFFWWAGIGNCLEPRRRSGSANSWPG